MLKLKIQGKRTEIQNFMKDFQSQPQYKIEPQPELLGHNENTCLSANIHYIPSPSTQAMVLNITTTSGKAIQLNLTDGKIVDMGNGITYIQGKIYDVFD